MLAVVVVLSAIGIATAQQGSMLWSGLNFICAIVVAGCCVAKEADK